MLFRSVNGSSLPIKVHINDHDLSILGRQFTKKCSVVTDGKHTKKVIYHDDGKRTVIYRRVEKVQKRKKKRSGKVASVEDIFQVLPCAAEEDLYPEDEDRSLSDRVLCE